jgi:molecular chaperone DnaJ
MATERDYYAILGIERTATDADIKKAFRRLAQQWHPDVNKDDGAHAKFKEINEAYQVLSDPQRRQTYDTFGRAGLGQDADQFGQAGFAGFGDIFDAFFGGATAGRRARAAAGADLRYDLRISFEESIRGAEKDVEFAALTRCETCSGTGAAEGTDAQTCEHCGGRGEVRSVRRTMLGQMVNVTTCPVCQGEGTIVVSPCPTCRGSGRDEKTRKLRVTIPLRAWIIGAAQVRTPAMERLKRRRGKPRASQAGRAGATGRDG